MTNLKVRPATSDTDLAAARGLCWAYRDFLADYSDEWRSLISKTYPRATYQDLMDRLPEIHARPTGIILLAELSGEAIGCGMVQPRNEQDAEIKRVFVKSAARGAGAGKQISQALIEQARRDGFNRVFLDTSRQFVGAQKLYEGLGFQRRGPYAETQTEIEDYLVFYELQL